MKYSKLIATTLTLLCLTSLAEAQHKREIVCFGDFNNDSGNLPFGWLMGDPAAGPFTSAGLQYPANSNGAKWIVQVGNLWKTQVEPSFQGGQNYSFANAQTSVDVESFLSLYFPLAEVTNPLTMMPFTIATGSYFAPSTEDQVNEFLSQINGVSKKAIIFFRTQGANNLTYDMYNPVGPIGPTGEALLAASDIVSQLEALKKAGYRNQVLFSFANPSQDVPSFGGTEFPVVFASALIEGLKEQSLHPVLIDEDFIFTDISNNYLYYGFTGGTGAMPTVTGPNTYLLWYEGTNLPSELYEYLYAQYVYNILEAPVCWGHMAEQPFALMRGQNAVLRQELYPITELCEGQLYPFISGSYAPEQEAPFAEGKAHDTSGWNGTIGFAYRCLPHWTVGIAGSFNENYFEDRHTIGKCEFDIDSWVVSLLSGMHIDRGYLNTIFNVGFMHFDDIKRSFSIGPKHWKAQGDTHGMQYDILAEGGWYFFRNDDCQMGPIATIEYQSANLQGYKERGAAYNNIAYKKQHADSFVTGLGLEALIWSPWRDSCASGFSMKMFLAANEDWVGKTRWVKFRQRVFEGTGAPFGEWPIYNERTFFGSGGISITNAFKSGAIFTVGYRGNWGQNDMREHNLTANLTFPLTKAKKGGEPSSKKGSRDTSRRNSNS